MPQATAVRITLDGFPDLAPNAPIRCEVAPRGAAQESRGLPDYDAVLETTFDRATKTVACRIFETVEVVIQVVLEEGDGRILGTMPCTLSAAQRTHRVGVPADTLAALAAWTKKSDE